MKVQLCLLFCTTCREEIRMKATIHVKLKNINFTRRGTPKAKTIMMWIWQLQYVVTLRILHGCLGIHM